MNLSPFDYALAAWILLALTVFLVLLKVRAPYGRHSGEGWGPRIGHRLAWFVMELPALIVFPIVTFLGDNPLTLSVLIFLILWIVHYVNRTIVFPSRMSKAGRRMPIVVVVSALFFNTVNGYLNGYYIGTIASPYDTGWLTDPRFLLGLGIFAVGMLGNVQSDNILLRLRRESAGRYGVPYGGLFRFVSCPNYLGEILEWIGFAILTWSPAAAAFAIWTAANLIPRALSNHRWYRERFLEYPNDRKALIPFLL